MHIALQYLKTITKVSAKGGFWGIFAMVFLFVLLSFSSVRAAAPDYQAQASKDTFFITATSSESVSLTISLKNTGTKTWEKSRVTFETGPFLRGASPVRSSDWASNYSPAKLTKDIKSKETATFTFSITAPVGVVGTIQENFRLVLDNKSIAGSMVRVFVDIIPNTSASQTTTVQTTQTIAAPTTNTNPITTTPATTSSVKSADFCIALSSIDKSQYAECQTPTETENTSGIEPYGKALSAEPIIRVGVYNTKAAQTITCNGYYDVYAGKNLLLSGLQPNYQLIVSFDFKAKKYAVSSPNITKITSDYIRFVPRATSSVMTMLDWSSRPAWNTSYNDNQFRNIIEFRYSEKTGNFWVINELPIDDYLKGIAETSNYSLLEFQKTLITAARTYVMYHYLRGLDYGLVGASTKHASEYYHVDATYDQVYKGYGSEVRMPKLVQAINETRGVIVTYGGNLAITPFFSNSDGRTRSWIDVWGGDAKPWLVSVLVPEDNGQTLWGHGVGMSARGAIVMASNGKSWQEILKYFYTGTKVQKIY